MRICFFTTDCVLPTKGGIEKVVYNLSKTFQEKGLSVIIISTTDSNGLEYPFDFQSSLPLSSDILHKDNIAFVDDLIQKYPIDIIINASHQTEVFKLCKLFKDKYSFKLISTLYCTPDALLKGLIDKYAHVRLSSISRLKKWIHILAIFILMPYRKYLRKKWIRNKYRYQLDNSDAFILESERYKSLFLDLVKSESPEKLYCIPNPLSTFSTEKHVANKTKTVLFVARMLIDQKRPDRMIDVWKKIYRKFPDWNLLMIGDGDDKERIIEYSKKRNVDNICFIGNTTLDDYYRKAEILCLTSTFEGFGLVLTEALQNGVIPIAFDSYNAVRDIIDDGMTGMLVKPFSIKGYADKLSILMSDAHLRNTMREKIRDNKLSSFSEDKVYSSWITLFDNLLSNNTL